MFPDRFQTASKSADRASSAQEKPRLGGAFSRADDGDRTRDPQLGKLMLYRLSYVRAGPTIAPWNPRPVSF
jgi:hypothetical protein